MFVIIVGGGKIGTHLLAMLLQAGHQVHVIENGPEVAERIRQQCSAPDIVFVGDGSSPEVLAQAGIDRAQVLAAVTGEDEVNLVITTLARFEFNVPRIIARVNNPKNAWLFTSEMGVDVAVNQADIMTQLIVEEMSLGDMMVLLKLRRGEYSLVEEKLPAHSRLSQAALKDLPLPENCVIAAVIRAGKVMAPRGNMLFETGDEILAVVSNESLPLLQKLFAPL